MAAEGTYA
jgi:long-subunit acyl-CoA synthetase (AMP-forming)